MRHRVLVLLLFLVPLAHAQLKDKNSHDRSYIAQAESDWGEQTVTNDPAVIERIMADDFVGISSQGKTYTKSDALADCKKPSEFASNHLSNVKVRFFGKTAVAQGSDHWQKKDGSTGTSFWTDTWVKRDGHWQLVAAQDAVVPD